MATFERTGPLRLEPQLDGSASQSVDCGVAACVMALDDASYGLVRPSTEAVRKRMGNDRDATDPEQWKAAIDAFADRFTALGLQPPRTSIVRGKGHDELWRLLTERRRRVIAALHYGTVATEKRALWASRSYRGNHAVYLRAAMVGKEARKVPRHDDARWRHLSGLVRRERRASTSALGPSWSWLVAPRSAQVSRGLLSRHRPRSMRSIQVSRQGSGSRPRQHTPPS